MSNKAHDEKIEGTDENWESGKLGQSEEHAILGDYDIEDILDVAVSMKPISIRLKIKMIDDLKALGKHHGVGYQILMRGVLESFINVETNRIAMNKIQSDHEELNQQRQA